MDVNKNSYTFGFATIMVVIVAALLSYAAIGLKPYQDRNIELEKQQNILSSVGVNVERALAENEYSKYIKPNYSILLNITKDHLDWHGSYKNYINSKFKIFLRQNKNNFAFISNKIFLKKFKKEKYKSKLKFINIERFNKIKKK